MTIRKTERVYSCSGCPVVDTWAGRFSKAGRLVVERTGERNLYDFIQSHAESVDIHVILKRFENGDVDALNRVQGFYGDVTDVPRTYADMLNKIREGEDYFNSLPVELKEQFGNNAYTYLAGLSDGSTVSKMIAFTQKLQSKFKEDSANVGKADSSADEG